MPEGHTLRYLANGLNDRFRGHRVRVASPQGRFADSAALIDGSTLVEADSAGKHLFIGFRQASGARGSTTEADDFIHIHLGLIGKLTIVAEPPEQPIGEVRLRLSTDGAYADLRGATICELITAERRASIVGGLGPDPLGKDADPQRAWARIRASHRPIGDLLMDQAVIAGVGNVYRAEVLFRHCVHPLREGRSLQRKQFMAMWDDLVELMAYGVGGNRIDTVRPEHTPEAMGRQPRIDDHGGEVYVYRRTGQPCFVCGAPVRTADLAGRNSFWCGRCQRAPRRTYQNPR